MKEYGLKGKQVFKKVKWKPIDKKRRAAQDTEEVRQWFAEYARLWKEYKIFPQISRISTKLGLEQLVLLLFGFGFLGMYLMRYIYSYLFKV